MAIGKSSQAYQLLSCSDDATYNPTPSSAGLSPSISTRLLSLGLWRRLVTILGILLLAALSFFLGRRTQYTGVSAGASPYSKSPPPIHGTQLTIFSPSETGI